MKTSALQCRKSYLYPVLPQVLISDDCYYHPCFYFAGVLLVALAALLSILSTSECMCANVLLCADPPNSNAVILYMYRFCYFQWLLPNWLYDGEPEQFGLYICKNSKTKGSNLQYIRWKANFLCSTSSQVCRLEVYQQTVTVINLKFSDILLAILKDTIYARYH